MVLLSRCFLRYRWRLKSLGKKNVSLIVDTKNARFMDHNKSQLGNCAEISSDMVKVIPSGRIMTDSQSINTRKTDSRKERH